MTDFRSDNESPAAPEIMAAVAAANEGPARAYGDDAITARLDALFGALFEAPVSVWPVATGTAANALAVAALTPPWGAVRCHPQAHLNVDECGAPEFYAGGAKLIPAPGEHGKIDPRGLAGALAAAGAHGEHETPPAVLSLTQATEAGTVYTPGEIMALAETARAHGMSVHMDGARFGNAVAHLGCAPADISWRAGVDVLSFGATKNGALAAEAIIDFRPGGGEELRRRRKRGGHLWSKMRFLSAQLAACAEDGLWLRLAARANAAAARLAAGVAALPGAELLHPAQANEVFVRLPPAALAALEAEGFGFHRWPAGGEGAIRLVASWCARDDDIDRLIACAGRALAAAPRL